MSVGKANQKRDLTPDLAIITHCRVLEQSGCSHDECMAVFQPANPMEPSPSNEDIDNLIRAYAKITQRIARITDAKLAKRGLTT